MTDTTIALKQHLIDIGLESDADFLRAGVQLLPHIYCPTSRGLPFFS